MGVLYRFLHFGDKVDISVVLQNLSDETLHVQVAARASNLVIDSQSQGFKFSVEPQKRSLIKLSSLTSNAGTAKLQVIAAASNGFSDSVKVQFPVFTPCTTEAFATYGEIDCSGQATIQPILSPKENEFFSEFGGLEVSCTSTAFTNLTDCFSYLYFYPFACSEQITSRVFAIASLAEMLHSFEIKDRPSQQQMTDAINDALKTLRSRQRADNGGINMWASSDHIENPYITIYVASMLLLVQTKAENFNFVIPNLLIDQILQYLDKIEINLEKYLNSLNSTFTDKKSFLIYGHYIRHRFGPQSRQRDAIDKVLSLFNQNSIDSFSLDTLAFLMEMTFSEQKEICDTIHRYLFNKLEETAETALFISSFSSGEMLRGAQFFVFHSNTKTNAAILSALIRVDSQNPVNTKLAKALLAGKKKGRWDNTHDNSFVLVALCDFFDAYESQAPDFVSRLWLDDIFVGEHQFQGYSTSKFQTIIPTSHLVTSSDQSSNNVRNIIVQKVGQLGRLYYRIGLSCASKNLEIGARDAGFMVERTYEAVEKPTDLKRIDERTWNVRLGAKIKVKLTIANQSTRYYVALIDKLPAGFEPLNPALKTSEKPPKEDVMYFWWNWYDHQNLRDERAEVFCSLLSPGVREYSYYCRATSSGHFVVPPAKAEEMYSPDVFGRSQSLIVSVVP